MLLIVPVFTGQDQGLFVVVGLSFYIVWETMFGVKIKHTIVARGKADYGLGKVTSLTCVLFYACSVYFRMIVQYPYDTLNLLVI